ncbi:uncharacterized MFS-type transporter YhjX-like isoform X2 [Saccostrea cucullata]|uniref:uncharacterized MFS-type transporter YhjX-like isoform X2 n=1 Tax=Saccostrea cuccullata TaxID=36930 RepID=UPI002ED1F753
MEQETSSPSDDPEVNTFRENKKGRKDSKDSKNEEDSESVGVSDYQTNKDNYSENTEVEVEKDVDTKIKSCPEVPKVLLHRILTDGQSSKPTPPEKKDDGFCWIVVIASFLAWFLFAGTRSSIGLIQEEFEKRIKESPTGLSWIGAMVNAIPLLLAPVISVLTKITSCGFLSSVGGVISCAGFLLVTFTDTLPLVFVGLGLLPGLGIGLMALPSTFMVSGCFDSRRGLVLALSTAGGGLGFIVFPIFFSFMVNFYGLKGTLLVWSALYLNGILFGIIYRQKEKNPKTIGKKVEFSEMRKSFCDRDAFCSHNFFSMILSNMIFGACDTIPFLFIPSKAERIGFSLELSAMLISAIGFTSITGRIGIGIFTGKSKSRRLGSFIVAFLVCSFSMALYAFTERYDILIMGSCVFGVSTGSFQGEFTGWSALCSLYSLQPMVLIDLFGIDKLVSSYGVINLSFGIGSLMAGSLTSALSVLLDDADFPFYMAGVLMILGAVSLGVTKCSCKRLKPVPQAESSDLSEIFVISHTATIGAPAA